MKQKLHSFFLFLILFIGQVNYVKADTTIASGTIDGTALNWEVTSADGTQENLKLSITGYGIIPSYKVNYAPWESYNSKITEVSLSSAILEIGDYAFYQMAISSIELPMVCTKIGESAFLRCTNLKEIYFPTIVSSIGKMAFDGCSSLSLIHFDGRCTENTGIAIKNVAAKGKFIEKEGTGTSYAQVPSGWDYYTHGEKCQGGAWVAESTDKTKLFFYSEYSGATVNTPASSSSSSNIPWIKNSNKHTSLEINRNISSIYTSTLLGYDDSDGNKTGSTNLQKITVEAGNKNYSVGKEGALYRQNRVLTLYPAASTATKIEIPAYITEIGQGAFYGAKNLQKVSFLGAVKKIGEYAFAQASKLNVLYFATTTAPTDYPVSTTDGKSSAFKGVANTGNVAADVETDAFKSFAKCIEGNWTFVACVGTYVLDSTLYVTETGDYNVRSSSASWYSKRNSIKRIIVEEGVTNIGDYAFENCTNVTEVTLKNTGTIGNRAFGSCTALTQINIGKGVTGFKSVSYSSSSPFYGCSKLSKVNVTSVSAYLGLTNLNYLVESYYGTASVKTLMVNDKELNSSSEVIIPYGITSIPSYTFKNFKNVNRLRLPSSMTKIEDGNFRDHIYLTEVTVPSSVKYIGNNAFNRCTALKTATLNITGYIDYAAFSGCTALTRVNIGTGLTELKCLTNVVEPYASQSYPFYGCSNLSEVNVSSLASFLKITNLSFLTNHYCGGTAEEKTLLLNGTTHSSSSELVIPEGVTEIPTTAFRYFKNVTKIKLPSTMTKIQYDNFSFHEHLTEVTVPSTVTSIGSNAFEYCTALKTVTLNNTGNIGECAFYRCKALTTVTLSSNVKSVERYAFEYCSALTTLTLNNTGYIEQSAFAGCTALTRVNVGTGLTELKALPSSSYSADVVASSYPFYGCKNLSVVNVSNLASFLKITNLGYITSSYYGGTAEEKTLLINGTTHSSSSELVIPEGVTEIPSEAFRCFKNVTKIKIPSTMTKIASSNFSSHKYLTEVTVPSTVTSIGGYAFQYCSALKTVTLNNKGSIGDGAFSNCSALTTVNVNNTGSIGDGAFYYCRALTNITLPSSVTSIGSYAFQYCTALTTVTLNNTGYINYNAFSGCTALTRVNIGTGLTELKALSSSSYSADVVASSYPFYGCKNLSEVNVSSLASFFKITNFAYITNSYYGGTAEEKFLLINGTAHTYSGELVIPEGITEIPSEGLRYFKNVTKIKLPSTMTKIASSNFSSHKYLKKITLPSTVTSVGDYAFTYCSNLKRIVCQSATPPVANYSIASNPSSISLKVPTGKTATYKAAKIWKEFSIDEGRTLNYNVTMLANENKRFANDLLDYQKVVTKTTTDASIASPTAAASIVQIKTGSVPTYDGTTTTPSKSAVIKLYLEDDDLLIYNVSVYPREVALTDGNAYKNATDFEAEKISYTRTYAEKYAGNLQCFYVPFDVEVTDDFLEDFTFYKLYMVSQKDENGNGEIEEDEPLVMLLNRIPAGQVMNANMPYYIRPKAESTLTVTAYNTTLYAATNGKVSCSTTEKEYTLTGNNASKNIKGYYTMSAKGNFSYYTKDTTLGSYRWYMSVRDRMGSGAEYENYARPIEILIVGEDDTTGIVALDDKASASKNDKIYTLDGRQVTDFETLPSGIYIVNGKKIYKK